MSLKDFLGYKALIEFGVLVKIHLTLNLLLEVHRVDKDLKSLPKHQYLDFVQILQDLSEFQLLFVEFMDSNRQEVKDFQ
jgi:hypothetical protein